jgi:hypothetical protein
MSDAYDLAKAGFDAAVAPIADLIKRMAGPAADEIGLMVQDHVKFVRWKRQQRLSAS